MIFSRFERTVAFRYLRPRGQGFISVIAWFSLLGIALGVATLIIVMSVMNGFRAELLGRVLGVNGHLTVMSMEGGPISDYEGLAEKLRAIKGVVSATPLVEGQVLVTANNAATGALVRGMRPDDFRKRSVIASKITAGTLTDFEGDSVIIGDRLAKRLAVKAGGVVTLVSPQGNATAFGTAPRLKSYRIAAVFNVGMYEYDSAFVYMPLEPAQLFFRVPEAATAIEVMVENAERVSEVRRPMLAVTGTAYRIFDWRQANASFFNALQVERNVMFLILTLIILVAAFNIISSLIMLVKEKGRAIAILRTMGATRGMIMRIFFLTGASVGVAGTFGGLLLGLVFCDNIESIRRALETLTQRQLFAPEIYFLSQLPAKVDPMEVVAVVLMALGLSLCATIYPSWSAARLDPVEALRNE